MRFTPIFSAGALAVLANAQTPDPASEAAQACLNKCAAGDVNCQSHCITVPSPNESQVMATTACVAKCPQGDGSPAQTQQYAACMDQCVSAHYYTEADGTPKGPGDAAAGAGVAAASGAATDSVAVATGTSDSGSGSGALSTAIASVSGAVSSIAGGGSGSGASTSGSGRQTTAAAGSSRASSATGSAATSSSTAAAAGVMIPGAFLGGIAAIFAL